MCLSGSPSIPAPPPPPPPPPQPTALKVEDPAGLPAAKKLAAQLGTNSLLIPLSTVSVPS